MDGLGDAVPGHGRRHHSCHSVFIDAGRIADVVADDVRKEVLNAYPKPTDGSYIADAIIEHGQRSPAAAPPGSLAAHLILQQRQREHRHG